MNIAFSFAGLTKLIRPRNDEVYFADKFFRDGAAASGDSKDWKLRDGDGSGAADVLIIVAADTETDVCAELDVIKGLISKHGGATVLSHTDMGEKLAGGREHFGYRDGISQPGLRGYAAAGPSDPLTPRENPLDPDQGKPGQELVWPGEFVFGYPGQVGSRDGRAPGGDPRYD